MSSASKLEYSYIKLIINGDHVTLSVGDYNYKWTLLSHPENYQGEETTHDNSLTLETSTAGSYQYQVFA